MRIPDDCFPMPASTRNRSIDSNHEVMLTRSSLVSFLEVGCRVSRAPAGQAAVSALLDGVREVVPSAASCLVVSRDQSVPEGKRLHVACAGPIAEQSPGLGKLLATAVHPVPASTGVLRPTPLDLDGRGFHALPALAEPSNGRRVALLAVRALEEPFMPRDSMILHAFACAVADPVVAAADRLEDMLDHLGARQRETLMHLCSGASEKEIAARIGRSHHTVHSYVKTIYRQLGVTSRAELVAMLMRAEATTDLTALGHRLRDHSERPSAPVSERSTARRSHRRGRAGTTPP